MAVKTANYDKTKAVKPKPAKATVTPKANPKPKPAVEKVKKVEETKVEPAKSDEFLKDLLTKTYPATHVIKYRKEGNSFDYTAQIRNMPTGCGLGVIYSITGLITAIPKDEFLKQLKDIGETQRISAFICTLGDTYYRYEENLLNLGFVEIACYLNKAHSGGSTQKLYLIDLTKIK